jgi:hypothetical protein
MSDEKIIIRDLEQRDYTFLMKALKNQDIAPHSDTTVPGRFGEPVTITVVLATTIGAPLAIGITGWLMSRKQKDKIAFNYEVEYPDGRTVKKRFEHTVTNNSATDPQLLKALKDALPHAGGQSEGGDAS